MKEEKRLRRKVRNSYVVSTISIALVLFLLGSVGYIMLRARDLSQYLRNGAILSIELHSDVAVEARNKIQQQLGEDPLVDEIILITREDKLLDKEFRSLFGEDFDEVLGDTNPLNDSFEVHFATHDIMEINRFTNRVEQLFEVESTYYPRELISSINSTIDRAQYIIALFAAVLLSISLVLIGNTVRLAIFSKRHIINTMKMVGATKWFIMKPLLWAGFRSGIFAGFISSLLFGCTIYLLREYIPEAVTLSNLVEVAVIGGIAVVGGGLISLFFTIYSVNRFINMRSNKIHLY